MRQVGFLLVIGVIATTSVATAKIWHVPDECPTILAGIDSAAAGDTVLVADGTYTGDGNRDIDFKGKAIVVMSENGPETTIIDCEGDSLDPHRGVYFHSEEDSSSVVRGFTITNGYALGDWPWYYGGAILCDSSSSPTIQGNTIAGNTAERYGGGISCRCYSSPTIEGNTITGNTAGDAGGAIYCYQSSSPTIEGNMIIGNTAEWYGCGIYCYGYSSPTIEGNTITLNTASYEGGGIYCYYYSSPTIEGNTITGNTADDGGGIYCRYYSSPTIGGNTITGNTASDYGGGIFCYDYSSPTVDGNTITGNTAGEDGAGISCWGYSSSPTIEGNTITGNTAGYAGGGIICSYTIIGRGKQNLAAPLIVDNIIADNPVGPVGDIENYNSPLTIVGNTIAGNTAYLGGGIHCFWYSTLTIVGNTITGNTADYGGGGVYCNYYSSPIIGGNTITGNTADARGGGIFCECHSSPTVLNSILWADNAGTGREMYVDGTSSIDITYSDIQGGWEGEGNIDAEPLFVLPEHRDYRLLWNSPCIDSGHPDSLDPDGTRSDMGAYPFDQSTPLTIYLTPDTTTIVRPGELGVTYTLINIEPDPWTFWLRSDVTLPNGKPYPGNPIIGPQKITLPGEKNIQKYLTHPVPGMAPLGIYTYKSRIGLPPDQLIDKDSFEFEVLE